MMFFCCFLIPPTHYHTLQYSTLQPNDDDLQSSSVVSFPHTAVAVASASVLNGMFYIFSQPEPLSSSSRRSSGRTKLWTFFAACSHYNCKYLTATAAFMVDLLSFHSGHGLPTYLRSLLVLISRKRNRRNYIQSCTTTDGTGTAS